MPFELEALVGHMYVAGGRTIKTTPPGSLCEVAPKRAVRGREIDTLFVLVLPSGNIAPNTFYEQMSLMGAERYFSSTGSVTSAIRDVFNTLNNNLFEHNSSGRKHYEANMIIAVMRGTDLYVARAGAATLALRHEGKIITVPESLTDDDKLFKPPLGVQPIPEVELSRYKLESGTRMVLADASIAEITDEKLNAALVAGNIEDVLDEFKMLVTLQIQMMVIEFVPPEQPVMVPAATGQSSAVIAAEVAAARAKTAAKQAALGDGETTEDAPEAQPQRPKRKSAQQRLRERTQNIVIAVARGFGHSLSRVGNLLSLIFGGEPTPSQRRRNVAFMIAAVFLLPMFLVATVTFSWVGDVGETEYEICVGQATNGMVVARTLSSEQPDNRDGLLAAYSGSLRIIDECQSLRPEFVDPNLTALRDEAQFAVDTITGITRRRTNAIWASQDQDANIREVILQGVDSIYAFDNVNNVVHRLQLNESGESVIDQQLVTQMVIGATVEGNTLRRLIGIAYDDQRDRIATLDENGVLVTCRPLAINQCDSQQLVGFETITNPVRFTFWQNNLYVLDTGGEQIWRYSPVGNTDNYSNTPTEYYQGGIIPPNIDQAVDFAIGARGTPMEGRVYTLYNDGTMTNFLSGENQGFAFRGMPPGLDAPEETTTQSMFLNDGSIFTGFYIVSRPLRTIYYFTAAGTFQNAFRIVNESLFERMNDVVADPEQNIIYVASGNAVLAFNANE